MSYGRNQTLVRKSDEHDSNHSSAPPSSLEEEAKVYFRPLKEDDKDEIRLLHQKWFPVQYKNIFYDSIVSNQMKSSDKATPPIPLFTCAALIRDYESVDKTSICGDSLTVKTFPPPPSLSITMCRDEYQGTPSPMEHYHHQLQHQEKEHIWKLGDKKTSRNYNCNDKIIKVTEDTCSNRDDVKVNNEASQQQQNFPRRTEKIIGCIVGSFNSLDNVDSSLSTFLIENPTTHSRVFYIMTLGTATDYRKLGIGSKLVERAISHAKQDERCGAVYLHVITYNQAAISFYVKLGFVFVQELEDYYSIDGEHYNCYIYAKYLNGNKIHESADGSSFSVSSLFYSLLSTCWRLMKFPAHTVGSAYASLRVKHS